MSLDQLDDAGVRALLGGSGGAAAPPGARPTAAAAAAAPAPAAAPLPGLDDVGVRGVLAEGEASPAPRGAAATPLNVAAESGRAILRGVGGGLEFLGDVADVPLEFGMFGTRGLANLRRRVSGAPLLDNPYPKPFAEEGAGDRLRAMATAASGASELAKRDLESGGPLLEGSLTALNILGTTLTPGGGFASAVKTARAAPTVLRKVLSALTSTPARIAVGGGGGKAVSEYADLGGSGTGTAIELGAMLAGLLASPAAARGGYDSVRKFARRIWTGDDVPGLVQRQVLQDLRAAASGDPEAILERLSRTLDEGRKGSLGVLSDDPGIRGVEAAVTSKTPGMRAALQASDVAARAQVADEIAAFGGGVEAAAVLPMATRTRAALGNVASSTRARTSAAEGAAVSAMDDATGALTGAQERAATAMGRYDALPDVEASGRQVTGAVETAREASRSAEKAAWAAVPKSELLDSAPIKRAVLAALPAPGSPAYREFARLHAPVMAEIDRLGGPMSGGDLIDVQQIISRNISAAGSVGGSGKATYADAINARMADGVKQALDAHPGTGPAYIAARNATQARIETFDTGPLGQARRATKQTPALLGERMAPRGTVGGETADAARAAGPEVMAATVESLRSRFRAAATNSDGSFNAAKAASFADAHAPAVARFGLKGEFDETVKKLSEARQAGRDFSAAERTIGRQFKTGVRVIEGQRETAQRAVRETPVGRFGVHESGRDAAIEALKKTSTRRRNARKLMRAAKSSGGTAVADLQTAYANAALDSIMSIDGTFKLGYRGRIDRIRGALGEVVDPTSMRRLDELMDTLDDLRRSGEIRLVEEGQISFTPGAKAKLVAVLARIGAAKIGGVVSSQPLIASNLASAAARRITDELPASEYNKLMAKYVMSPREYLDDLRRFEIEAPPPAPAGGALGRAAKAAGSALPLAVRGREIMGE